MAGSKRHAWWGLILAGGDGTRLRPLTRQITGDDRPKQFCPILDGSAGLTPDWATVPISRSA